MKIGNWQLERCTNKTTTSTLLGQILHCDGGRPIINGFSRILATLELRNEAFDKWTLNCQEKLFCFSGWLTFPYIDSYVWLFFGDHWLRVIKFVNHALLLARRPTDSSKWGCALDARRCHAIQTNHIQRQWIIINIPVISEATRIGVQSAAEVTADDDSC